MPSFLTGLVVGFFIGVMTTAIVAIHAIQDARDERMQEENRGD